MSIRKQLRDFKKEPEDNNGQLQDEKTGEQDQDSGDSKRAEDRLEPDKTASPEAQKPGGVENPSVRGKLHEIGNADNKTESIDNDTPTINNGIGRD